MCYESVELDLVIIDEMLQLLIGIYIPENWYKIVYVGKDIVDLFATIENYCKMELFASNVIETFSVQGVSGLASRIISSLIQYPG